MTIKPSLRSVLIEAMWCNFKIGASEAEEILASLEKENYFPDIIQQKSDISKFINGNLYLYLYPNKLNRLQVYDQQYLDDNKIVLDFVKSIPDGWDCNLYFDRKNNLYWEDNYGRYTKEGFKISPYLNPIKIY